MTFVHFGKHKLNNLDVLRGCWANLAPYLSHFLPGLRSNHFTPNTLPLGQTASRGFHFHSQKSFHFPVLHLSSSSLSRTLREVKLMFDCGRLVDGKCSHSLCMTSMLLLISRSQPSLGKWFCTLCLFNEIVTLMAGRLIKTETTASVCHLYDLFFFSLL